jgi:hypothetical protein
VSFLQVPVLSQCWQTSPHEEPQQTPSKHRPFLQSAPLLQALATAPVLQTPLPQKFDVHWMLEPHPLPSAPFAAHVLVLAFAQYSPVPQYAEPQLGWMHTPAPLHVAPPVHLYGPHNVPLHPLKHAALQAAMSHVGASGVGVRCGEPWIDSVASAVVARPASTLSCASTDVVPQPMSAAIATAHAVAAVARTRAPRSTASLVIVDSSPRSPSTARAAHRSAILRARYATKCISCARSSGPRATKARRAPAEGESTSTRWSSTHSPACGSSCCAPIA